MESGFELITVYFISLIHSCTDSFHKHSFSPQLRALDAVVKVMLQDGQGVVMGLFAFRSGLGKLKVIAKQQKKKENLSRRYEKE